MSAPDYDRAWTRGMAADLNAWKNAQRNPLRTPDLTGPTQQFGADPLDGPPATRALERQRCLAEHWATEARRWKAECAVERHIAAVATAYGLAGTLVAVAALVVTR